MGGSALSKLMIILAYLLLVVILFNGDKSWPKFKHVHRLTCTGINAQPTEEPCDYPFSTWEEEEEHGENCDDVECQGACLEIGYGTQTSRCLNEEMCCCNYDNVPAPQPLPQLETENFGINPDPDFAPDLDGAYPIPCEDTAMEDQMMCDHANCGQACQLKGFVIEVSLCYRTGTCCCNNEEPCARRWSLIETGGICNNRACKHVCGVLDFSSTTSFCFNPHMCCCKDG